MRFLEPALRWAAVLAALVLTTLHAAPGAAQTGTGVAPLVAGNTNTTGVVAEVVECKRKEGVLTLKVRFRNTTQKDVRFDLIGTRNYDDLYVTAGSKKYFVLRDSEKTPLAVAVDVFGKVSVNLDPGASWTWWAKYPAPPADVRSVSYFMPVGPPLEDIPVSDL